MNISFLEQTHWLIKQYPKWFNRSIDNILYSLSTSIEKIGLAKESETKEIFESLIESYNSPLLITVLGEFSSGKSTFINALLREKLLPMKQRETTATITKLQYGKRREVSIFFKDGTRKNFDLLDNFRTIDDYIVENENNAILDKVKYVNIELNKAILEKIDLADTPGFNTSYKRHTEITEDFIKFSDLVIWLFDARKMGKASELITIADKCKYFKPIGVVNWINKLELQDGESVENNLKPKLEQIRDHFEKFFLFLQLMA